jgi:sporulation protein YlmC with PRC-barrel domain
MRVDPNNLEGVAIHDPHGEAVGHVEEVFVDEKTRQPEWVVVQTGTSERFVPLVDIKTLEVGIQVPFSKEQIGKAPRVHFTDRLIDTDERALYDHYGVAYGTARSDTLLPVSECTPSCEPGWKEPTEAPVVEKTYRSDMAAFREYALLRWSLLKGRSEAHEEPAQIGAANLEGSPIFDAQGNDVGRVEDVFVDEKTHRPEWLLVAIGTRERLVPVVDLKPMKNGLQLPFGQDRVVAAPSVAAEDVLTEADERRLCDHYGIARPAGGPGGPLGTPLETPLAGAQHARPLAPFREYVLRRWSGIAQ